MSKARIDGRVLTVKVIDKHYNEHAAEVQIMEGIHKGQFAIIEKSDMITEPKRYIVQISDFNYNTNTWQYKNRKHVATIEEAKKLKKELSYKEARIFDRITKEYL